ncbi:PQQ-dependent sugar dehydrogenase [Rhodocaloribacter litoris]|uniref:PQQ-dependent sugar dehydrogenase n=1 Tax=Rhodocaloribacter litoris TaxID=2558931 RepID=UPI0014239293|nr:PQQ-dependent sugar dehydrogenase [Rhodocaloribacter litoris]QXD15990.1 PQQ-dependent sugar dehydrogenase [Rhodocaloribacter litoris]
MPLPFRLCPALLAFVLLTGCDGSNPAPPDPPPPSVPISVPEGFRVEIVAEGLALPTSLAFAPDGSGRLFVNELQTGRIRVIRDDALLPEPFAEVATNVSGGFPVAGENGLIGLAFDPDFRTNGFVYVTYAVRLDDGTNRGAVARFREVDGRGTGFTVLLDGIPAAPGHQIQSLAFGPDGKLYVSVGDAYLQEAAQDTTALTGKILRMNPDGSVPPDNPFPGRLPYALGLRNAFDLAFDGTGRLFAPDNGPSFNDELNRIEAGGNYGWPVALGPAGDPRFIDPIHTWTEIVSPNGLTFYRGTTFPPPYRGRLFLVLFGDTFSTGPSPRAKRIVTVDTGAEPPVIEDFAVYDFPGQGNPLDVVEGPDGHLYFTDIFQGRVYRIRYDG